MKKWSAVGVFLAVVAALFWYSSSGRSGGATTAPEGVVDAALERNGTELADAVVREPGALDDQGQAHPRTGRVHVERTAAREAQPFRLFGRVVDAWGDVVVAAKVLVHSDESAAAPVGESRTHWDGSFELEFSGRGEVRVTIDAAGYEVLVERMRFDAPTNELEHVFHLEREPLYRIDLVTSDDVPARGVLREHEISFLRHRIFALATEVHPGKTFDDTGGMLSDPRGIGRFRAGVGDARTPPSVATTWGWLRLNRAGPAFVSLVVQGQVLDTRRVTAHDRVVTFTLDPEDFDALRARLVARVVDAETGEPLAGGSSLLATAGGPDPLVPFTRGVIEHDVRYVGPRTFEVEVEGFATHRREIVFAPGETVNLGTLRLSKGLSIRGRIEGRDSLRSSFVTCQRLDAQGRFDDSFRELSATDEQAGFEFTALSPGKYALQFHGISRPGRQPADQRQVCLLHELELVDQDVNGVVMTLVETTELILETGRGRSQGIWSVTAFDLDGHRVRRRRVGRYSDQTTFSLPPGSYQLVLALDGIERARKTVSLGSEAHHLRWALE